MPLNTSAAETEILERLQALVKRAEQGDESALPELRAALDTNPWIWERYGDLARQSQAAWLQLIAGPNLLLRESVERKAEQLRAELAGAGILLLGVGGVGVLGLEPAGDHPLDEKSLQGRRPGAGQFRP